MGGPRIVVPMKPLAESKSRLRGALPDDRRRLLSLAMLVHVLQTAAGVREAAGMRDAEVLVLGGDGAVELACRRTGARFVEETTGDLNACLATAFEAAGQAGRAPVLFVPADLPLLAVSDIDSLLRAAADEHVVIAPDRHNAGTNGLAVHGAATLAPMMGNGSFQRHLAQFAMAGTRYEILRTPGLGLDIDTAADLDALTGEQPGWWDRADALARDIDS